MPPDGDGAVGGGRDGSERHPALAGEVAQLDDLGRPGAGGDQAVHARVDPGVEDRDQDSASVVRGVQQAELIDARVPERHEPGHERDRRCRKRPPAGQVHAAVRAQQLRPDDAGLGVRAEPVEQVGNTGAWHQCVGVEQQDGCAARASERLVVAVREPAIAR